MKSARALLASRHLHFTLWIQSVHIPTLPIAIVYPFRFVLIERPLRYVEFLFRSFSRFSQCWSFGSLR